MGLYRTRPTSHAARRAVRRAYLLDLDLDRRYRLSTEPRLTITDSLGVERQYCGGLLERPEVVREVNREGASTSGASIPLFLALDGVDIPKRIAQGAIRVEDGRGSLWEVFLDADGAVLQGWHERIAIIVNGRLMRPTTGDPEDATSILKLTLEDEPYEDTTTLINPAAVIDATTWPQADSGLHGTAYPLIFGTPGDFTKEDGSEGTTSGAPAFAVRFTSGSADYVLVADGVVAASTVRLFAAGVSGGVNLDVKYLRDGRNRYTSVVDVSGQSSAFRTASGYWTSWKGGGGIVSDRSGAALSRLGETLRWITSRGSMPIDDGAWLAERSLDDYRVSCSINDPGRTPHEALMDFTERIPGLTLQRGPNGIRPIRRRPYLREDDAAFHVTEGPDFSPLTPWVPQSNERDYRNAVTVRFAERNRTGTFRRHLTCTPAPSVGSEAEFSTHYAAMSHSRLKRVYAETWDLWWVYSEGTAGQLAAEWVQQQGFNYETRDYFAALRYGDRLEEGEVFLLSSDNDTRMPVRIGRVVNAPGGYVVTIEREDDPVRRAAHRAV